MGPNLPRRVAATAFDNVTRSVLLSHDPMAGATASTLPASTGAMLPGLRRETQARIMDAAFACVAELGLGRTTMDDVARRAGVSRQTVYRYYPSKDQLVMALVLREEDKFLDGIRAAFAAAPPGKEASER